jgi:hypothetical protein
MCKALLDILEGKIAAMNDMKRPKWEEDKARLATLEEVMRDALESHASSPMFTAENVTEVPRKRKYKKRRKTKTAARGGTARRKSHAQATA